MLGELQVVGRVPSLHPFEVTTLGETLQSVVPHRLQESIPVPRHAIVELHHRLRHETARQIEHVEHVDVVVGDDRLGVRRA